MLPEPLVDPPAVVEVDPGPLVTGPVVLVVLVLPTPVDPVEPSVPVVVLVAVAVAVAVTVPLLSDVLKLLLPGSTVHADHSTVTADANKPVRRPS